MFDHLGFVVKNLEAAVSFYEACLAPIGFTVIERHDYGAVIFARSQQETVPFIWIGTGVPDFWQENSKPSMSPLHLCFTAKSKEAVDAFFKAALSAGGKDNGQPGPRGSHYYAAYVIDPDGNNIEASYRF